VNVSAHDPDGTIDTVEFYVGTTKVGERTSAPFSLTLSNLPIGDHILIAIASDDDGASAMSLNSPIVHVLPTTPATLTSAGAEWRYFDKTNDLGTAWRSNSFNDATWSNGLARFGYGGDGEVTTIASNRQWTTYFRRAFYIPNPAFIPTLNARLTRDDAAVIYLNGAEVWRDTNITTGVITNQTPTLSALGGTNETNWLTKTLSPTNLLQGWNLLAAEVHNQSLNSSDLGFDFELTATQIVPQPPAVAVTLSNSNAILSWPADAGIFTLCSATSLLPTTSWSPMTNAPFYSNGVWSVPIPFAAEGSRFYRLQSP
jgi:hypothetical protein